MPEITKRNRTMPRKPSVSSARRRRFAGVSSFDLAIFLGAAWCEESRRGRNGRRNLPFRLRSRLERDAGAEVLVAHDLDLEVGGGVAVDVALDDGEFLTVAGLVGHRELPRGGEGRIGNQREALVAVRGVVRVDA